MINPSYTVDSWGEIQNKREVGLPADCQTIP